MPTAYFGQGEWIDWTYDLKLNNGNVMHIPCKAYKDKWGVWVVGDEMNRISKMADDLLRGGKPY